MRAIPMRLVLASASVIALMAMTYAATSAYFSGTATTTTSISTATIGVQPWSGFPLNYSNLLPGESQEATVQVKNNSTAKADFFTQLISDGSGTNFCATPGNLFVKIVNVNEGATRYNGDICNLFPGWSGSTIAKTADDVAAGAVITFKVTLTLSTSAGNALQGANNADYVNLIAVQYNGPAPVAQTASPGAAWPAGDSNYN